MKVEVFTKGVDGHDQAGDTLGQVEGNAHVVAQTFVGNAAEVFEQITIITKIHSEHFG